MIEITMGIWNPAKINSNKRVCRVNNSATRIAMPKAKCDEAGAANIAGVIATAGITGAAAR